MRFLPSLARRSSRWVLPVADRSAAALVCLLLADDTLPPAEALDGVLADDPPLALWTACVAAGQADFRPGSLEDLTGWLAEHALEVLQWEGARFPPQEAIVALQPDVYADRVAAAVELADLAAQLAAGQGPPHVESAFLLGLLGDAEDWLAASGGLVGEDPSTEDAAGCLPGWLSQTRDTPASVAVELAGKVLDGRELSVDSGQINLETARNRGAQSRQRWLQPLPAVAGRLPILAARLARLETLDARFQEAVETEKLEAMAEFAAGAGHEINNPLAVIAGRAQYFLDDEPDPERRRALALMNAQAKRVYEMIADMMLFARPPRPEPELIDLVELVDRVLADFAPRAGRQETTLRRSGDAGPVPLTVDPTQLTVALRAMCQNSLEAIGHEGHIEIQVRRGDRRVELRVSDDGPGITPQQRRHLFDPYYSARQAGRGLGLGLSKCWRIVTNHGGRIEVDSSPGKGAAFLITLPTT